MSTLSSSSSLAEKEGPAGRGGEEEKAAVGAIMAGLLVADPPTGAGGGGLSRSSDRDDDIDHPEDQDGSDHGHDDDDADTIPPMDLSGRTPLGYAGGKAAEEILREGQGRVDAVVRWGGGGGVADRRGGASSHPSPNPALPPPT